MDSETSQMIWDAAFGNAINLLIFVLAAVNAIVLTKAYTQIKQLKKDLFEGDAPLERFVRKRLGQEGDIENQLRSNFSKMEDSYNAATRWFHIFSSIISVFPLLGILGTILGIIPAVSDLGDITDSFSLALVSTLLGVSFAGIFKIFEGILSGDFTIISERITVLTSDVTKHIIEKEVQGLVTKKG
ncbi:MotA/TolQ/ExbB proton channel family protein [Flammeovirgaceae bacterium SG7u.111]|nr:MotA/TolQ/ExbB proton channel family protein [Flammeovirgaceae bacterium SG7u.132]WPO35476.1 MotA/TolQ/ExbB proton channel family protein [Flammeovirgaceae bacterium SG7u.111]